MRDRIIYLSRSGPKAICKKGDVLPRDKVAQKAEERKAQLWRKESFVHGSRRLCSRFVFSYYKGKKKIFFDKSEIDQYDDLLLLLFL